MLDNWYLNTDLLHPNHGFNEDIKQGVSKSLKIVDFSSDFNARMGH